jgi:Fur family zinc uptake transcriptional regulator
MAKPLHKSNIHNTDALAQAAARAAAHGQRWTESRAQTYGVMLTCDQPVTAYELLEKVAKRFKRAVKPASIYRALEAFCSLGLAVRVESLNAFVLCRHPDHPHQHVFLICQSCGQTDMIADQAIGKKMNREAAEHGFAPQRQVLEVYGACRTCRG